MARNEPNMPDDVKTTLETEQAGPFTEAPAPEMTAEEAAILAHEGKAAAHDIGDDGLEPPTPSTTLKKAALKIWKMKNRTTSCCPWRATTERTMKHELHRQPV